MPHSRALSAGQSIPKRSKPQDGHAHEGARLAEVEGCQVALLVPLGDGFGHAVGQPEGDAVVGLAGLAERSVERLVQHRAHEAPVDALTEADRDAAVAGIPLLLRLSPEQVTVDLVDGHVAPATERVVEVVERLDGARSLARRERVMAVAVAGVLSLQGAVE